MGTNEFGRGSGGLFRLLDDLGVAATLERWRDEALEARDPDGAREHEQVWRQAVTLLDELVETLGDRETTLVELLQVLESGLEGIRLGLIPPSLDSVVVGTIERSRHYGIRAALILGATEKDFPRDPPEDAILDDGDRERLGDEGVRLAPTSRTRLFHEQYYAYLALTRASEWLRVSWPEADENGRPLAPSPVVARLAGLVPEVRERLAPAATDPLATVATRRQLASALARELRRARSGGASDPAWLDLYPWVISDPGLKAQAAPILAAVDYEEGYWRAMAPLGPDLAGSLYGAEIRSSVTRLESFAACPFQHFARHGLVLEGRARHQVEAPELGRFYHAALARFVRRLGEEGLDWRHLPEERARRLLDEIVEDLAPRLAGEVFLEDPQNRFLLRAARRTLERSLDALAEHARRGRFRPAGVEVEFGRGGEGALPPITLELSGGRRARLSGRIDRIDLCEEGGRRFLRVIDYKSGTREFRLWMVLNGLALQLPVYLWVASLGEGAAAPAGVLYFRVHDSIRPATGPLSEADARAGRLKSYKTNGLVLHDPQVIRWMDEEIGQTWSIVIPAGLAQKGEIYKKSSTAPPERFATLFRFLEVLLSRLLRRIWEGEVAIAPYRISGDWACRLCEMGSVCQFDPGVEGQGFRALDAPAESGEVWNRMDGVIAAGVGEAQ